MAHTFSESKIVLNDASFDDLNMRFFEALASGSLLISNPTNGSAQDILFHDGADYVCHQDYDLIKLMRYYLANDSVREEIAARGMQRVLSAHTYRHRALDLLDVVTGRKQDTLSAIELRELSRTKVLPPVTQAGEIQSYISSIITTRSLSQWPTWQMIHEWEDILGRQLAVPFQTFDDSCTQACAGHPDNGFDLLFLPLATELSEYTQNHKLIPVVMDLWRDDFDAFIHHAPNFKLVFATNLQSCRELSLRVPNLRYLPFTLADQYLHCTIPEKDIDIIHYGRRNPLLDQYMQRLVTEYPDIHYVTTDKSKDGTVILIHSNRYGVLGESDSRIKFMNLLCRSRVSLVSTVGMDGSRQTGGIDPISPRFLESMAAGCHLVGRIPDNDEFRQSGLSLLCHHVDSYQEFAEIVLRLLNTQVYPKFEYYQFLQQRLTSSLVQIILDSMASPAIVNNSNLNSSDTGAIIDQDDLRNCFENGVNIFKSEETAHFESTLFANYQVMADVAAYYNEFHAIDCFDLFTTILQQLKEPAHLLLISALELAYKRQMDAACILAYRATQIMPADSDILLFYANLLAKAGKLSDARTIANQLFRPDTDFQLSQAILDTCTIIGTLPLQQEHYHVLHAAHVLLRPRRYIEIGISNGKSLALTKKGTLAIGIDPVTASTDQQIYKSPEVSPTLCKLASNDFFEQALFEKKWESKPFDMAFIDGLHCFEQVLMDFIHLELRSSPNSVIFIHDCLPVSIAGAERNRTTMVWTGDVWKLIVCLKHVRPDLEIVTFPVRPSGLAMVRNLNRKSQILATQFDALVTHFMDAKLPVSLPERFQLLNVTDEAPETVLNRVVSQQGTFQ
jgi:hypothetical protein